MSTVADNSTPHFSPGQPICAFTTKAGNAALIRYPRWEDIDAMTAFANALSQEDTFTILAGEEISRDEQTRQLAEAFHQMERGDYVYLCCFIDEALVGGCGIVRNRQARTRKRHVGIFDIAISREARGQGIGYQLAQTTIDEAKKTLVGLRMLFLEVYEKNVPAIKLYHKLGFEEAGRISQAVLYRGHYIDDIEMTRPL